MSESNGHIKFDPKRETLIYMALPTGGHYLPCAVQGGFNCTQKGLRVHPGVNQFGDIPHNFNCQLCEAMVGRRDPGFTHFAMLHSDIAPQQGWLDILLEEMDKYDADIMSATMAIKDDRGLTCTGVRYPGVWGTRRYTMHEIMRLPETFCIKDTHEPNAILAINTGCWLARLPLAGWPDKFPGFQNEHKIVWQHGEPNPWFDSEDWLFSDWAASQGLKVYSTRKLITGHQGAKFFYNQGAWGTWETELQPPCRELNASEHKFPVDPEITVETEYPIAVDSLDHKAPLGSRIDNTFNKGFNKKLLALCPAEKLRVLDLGCSGGGFVRSILDDGGFAIGIEGSDFSLKRKRCEWGYIPNYLFTADATKPFTVRTALPYTIEEFNVITGWEFWEHIPEGGIDGVLDNIARHASPGAVFIGSISSNVEPHHCTAKPRDWWIERLALAGWEFIQDGVDNFGYDVVRGQPNPAGVSYTVVFRIKPTEEEAKARQNVQEIMSPSEELMALAEVSPPESAWWEEDLSPL